jgi:hypothetical protein
MARKTRVVVALQEFHDQQQHRSPQIQGVSHGRAFDCRAEISTLMSRNRESYPHASQKSLKRGLKRGLDRKRRSILLMLDETIITETPPLYNAYGHIGERTSSDDTAKAGVVELLVKRVETGLDVPQALAIGQLSEGQAQELIVTGEVADSSIAVITCDAAVELVFGQVVHQLGEDVAVVEHEPGPDALRRMGTGSRLLWRSDQTQLMSRLTSEIATRSNDDHRR